MMENKGPKYGLKGGQVQVYKTQQTVQTDN